MSLTSEFKDLSDEDQRLSDRRAAIARRRREIIQQLLAEGRTQDALSAELGISQTRVSRLLRGV